MSAIIDITIAEYDAVKLHMEFIAAGLPMESPHAGINPNSNKAHFDRDLTAGELVTAEAVMAAHIPEVGYAELRRAAYAVIQRNEYWEAIMEALETPKRTERLDALQAKRMAIKDLYPKPE